MRLESLKRFEWVLSTLLSLVVLSLLIARATHAGALWRDECAALQLARMPTFAEIGANFQHEAFPLLFPTTIRLYTNVFGASDTALRCFGLAVGVLFIAATWFNLRIVGSVPLLSLALIGLNTGFLTWGTSIRGYGLGSVLIILAFGFILKVVCKPTTKWIAAACLVCLASVQCLVHNAALLLAIGLSAIVVSLMRHDLRRSTVIAGIGALCMISLLPYIRPYSNGSAWNIVVQSQVTPASLWNNLNWAFGAPLSLMPTVWLILFVTLLGASITRLYHIRGNKPAPEWDRLMFGVLVLVVSVITYYAFLQILSYVTRTWYYLALLSTVGIALDLLAASLSRTLLIRLGRILFVLIALVLLPSANWPKIVERQTNIDVIAHQLENNARPSDLIVVSFWHYGISFNRYYHGVAPWLTLPQINDHRIHRYDLFMAKMVSPKPIDDVLDAIDRTLASGNSVWFVGGVRISRNGETTLSLSPAPDSKFGWNNKAYMESWTAQLGAFVTMHAAEPKVVTVKADGPVNDLEDIPLMVVQGWRD